MNKELDNLITISKWYGAHTSLPSFLISDNYFANVLNVSLSDLSPTPFKQYSTFGNQTISSGKILKTFTSLFGTGLEVPLRVRDDGTYSHYEWYNSVNSTWETLLANQTTAKTPSIVDFNTGTQDETWWCNGTNNMTLWRKAIGTVASNTSTVITLNETSALLQGFKTGGGTVIVNGTEYTYTGISGKTITGLTGLPTFTVNQGVAEFADDSTYSALAKMDLLWVADGRMWGAISTLPRLYYSAVGDATNWTASTTPDSPGYRDFVEGEGPITGISSIKEKIIVFKRDLAQLYWFEYPDSTTRVAMSQEYKRGDSAGAVNHHAITKIGDSIWYATTKGGIKSITLTANENFDFEDEMKLIHSSLKNGVFTSAKTIYFEKEQIFLMAYKKNSNSTANDYIAIIEFADDETGKKVKVLGFLDWTIGDFFKYYNDLYFGSSYEMNTFKAFDGYQKGGTDVPFTALLTTKRFRFTTNPLKQKDIQYIALTGYIGAGTTLNLQAEYDYLGSRAHLESSFSASETQYIIEPEYNMIGAFALGTEPIGGTTEDIEELNYFKIFFRMPEQHHPYDLQLTLYSEKSGSRWKIESLSFIVEDSGKEIPSTLKKFFK